MKIIFGLGNPGKDYVGTRHNVGYDALDDIGLKQVSGFLRKDRFKAEVAETSLAGEKILLARPLTFYNLVGESYRAICDFYKLTPDDTLIIHDELALPFGTIRVREGGSDAGNNGIKSINQHGGAESLRLRVGVANDQRAVMGDTDFVLGRFSKEERTTFEQTLAPTLHALVEDFASGSLAVSSHRHEV